MKTNLSKCKKMAKLMFDMVPIQVGPFGTVQHPWVSSTLCNTMKNGEPTFVSIEDADFEDCCREKMNFQVERCKSISNLCFYINKPWRLFYIRLLFEANIISSEDLGTALNDIWTTVENISGDVNVSYKDLVEMFQKADENTLMTNEEIEYLHNSEDMLTLYRGVTGYNIENRTAMSYTDDEETAKWFARRFPSDVRQVWKIQIPKSKVLAYYNNRSEHEFVIDPIDVDVVYPIEIIQL